MHRRRENQRIDSTKNGHNAACDVMLARMALIIDNSMFVFLSEIFRDLHHWLSKNFRTRPLDFRHFLDRL